MKKLILASSSPTRKRLLTQVGYAFDIEPSDYEEDMTLPMPPEELVKFLSQKKAESVATKYKGEDVLILGADTFVVFENHLLGKPHTPERAKEMLTMLSGKAHIIITGYTVIDAKTEKAISNVVGANVYFRNLSKKEIEEYVATGEPLNKAGSYALQEKGAFLVEKIEGSDSTIAGLPLSHVVQTLKEFGISPF